MHSIHAQQGRQNTVKIALKYQRLLQNTQPDRAASSSNKADPRSSAIPPIPMSSSNLDTLLLILNP